jgi:selenocysteine-specific elongation factor
MEGVAELILHSEKQVAPGASVFARVKLPTLALLLPGDRFIIRQFSPLITIGGGVVLDPAPMKRAPDLANFLTLLATKPLDEVILARVARRRGSGISVAALIAETGKTQNEIEKALSETIRSGRIARVGTIFMDAAALLSLKTDLVSAVRQFHTRNPLVPGVNREQLRGQKKISSPTFSALVDDLVKNRQLEIVEDLLRLPGHGIVMKDDEAESRKKIEDAFAVAGLKVPLLYEVIAGLKIDKTRAQKIVTLLLREKVLIKIADDLVFHQKALAYLRQQIADFKTKSPKIDVAQFKELTGVSRKYAIPLLEYLDRERVTKRVGDAREIL